MTAPTMDTLRVPSLSQLQVEVRGMVTGQLRILWRRGRSAGSVTEVTRLVQGATSKYVTDTDVTAALAWAEGQRQCEVHRSKISLTPQSQCVFTLVDEVLDRPLADYGRDAIDHAAISRHVAGALTRQLDRALRLNTSRTLEYLLRARHGLPAENARALATELVAARLGRSAALLLTDLAPLPAATSGDPEAGATSEAIVRDILGLTI